MDNSQKTPLALSLASWNRQAAASSLQQQGRALPCSVVSVTGSIVTVKFDVDSPFTLPHVTMPLFGPEYIRYPIQPGDRGMTIAADARLVGVAGLSTSTSTLGVPANLACLAFLPLGNTAWFGVDPNALVAYGPNGVVLQDTGAGSTFILTPTTVAVVTQNSFSVTVGGTTFTMTPSGYSLVGTNGNIQDGAHHTSPTIMNAAWAAMVTFLNTHVHGNGNGGANTTATTVPFSGGSIAP